MLRKTLIGMAAALALGAGSASALAQGTAFTYQGQLKNSGAVVNSATDMQFSLWNDPTLSAPANQVGGTFTSLAVPVSQGLFTSAVDFGINPYTLGQNLYLQIAARNPAGSGSYVPMGTRQLLTPTPFSLATRGISVDSLGEVGIGTTSPQSTLDVLSINNHGSFRVADAQPGTGPAAGTQLLAQFAGNNSGGQIRFVPSLTFSHWMDVGLNTNNDFVVEGDDIGRLVVQNTGNVGIGTASPAGLLDVVTGNSRFTVTPGFVGVNRTSGFFNTEAFGVGVKTGNTGYNGMAIDSAASSGLPYYGYAVGGSLKGWSAMDGAGNMFFYTGGITNENFRISASGNIGIRNEAPSISLDAAAGSTIGTSALLGANANDALNQGTKVAFGWSTTDNSCGPVFGGMKVLVVPGTQGCGNSVDLAFWTAECQTSCTREVMRINGSGNVGIGTASPGAFSGFRLDVGGNVRCVALTQTSCRELKQDIAPLTGALDSIMRMHGVSYAWNSKAPEPVQGKHDIGFIADEMNDVLPDIVAKDESGKPIGIDYGKVTPVAVEAIKQLKNENDQLKARLEKLESLVAAQASKGAK